MFRVLVLDDEPLIAMMLADWLKEMACEPVGPVADQDAALALVEGPGVDAAILDVRLGGGDSYRIAALLRARGVPIAFASGYGTGGIAAEFRDAPALPKPYDFENVRDVVRAFKESRAQPRGAA